MIGNNILSNNRREITLSNILHQKSLCNFLMIKKWSVLFSVVFIFASHSFNENLPESINWIDNNINMSILLNQNSVNSTYQQEQKQQNFNRINSAKLTKYLHLNLINKSVLENEKTVQKTVLCVGRTNTTQTGENQLILVFSRILNLKRVIVCQRLS